MRRPFFSVNNRYSLCLADGGGCLVLAIYTTDGFTSWWSSHEPYLPSHSSTTVFRIFQPSCATKHVKRTGHGHFNGPLLLFVGRGGRDGWCDWGLPRLGKPMQQPLQRASGCCATYAPGRLERKVDDKRAGWAEQLLTTTTNFRWMRETFPRSDLAELRSPLLIFPCDAGWLRRAWRNWGAQNEESLRYSLAKRQEPLRSIPLLYFHHPQST